MILLPFKDPAETLYIEFSFLAELGIATITSATVQVTLRSGTDATPSAILGTSTIQGGSVMQKVQGGVACATYGLICTATLSDGTVLARGAYLPVRSALEW